jgi:hypothetical protein
MIRRMSRFALATFLAVVLLVGVFSGGAFATYNRTTAKNWADTYWNTLYPPGYSYFPPDCTNFVSQCIHQGGYPYKDMYNYNTTSWWFRWLGGMTPNASPSWQGANALRNFLLADYPGGVNCGSVYSPRSNSQFPSSMTTADVLNWNWGLGEGISHSSILVGQGTCQYGGGTGWLLDQHASNRYHEIWTLWPTNENRLTTTVYFTHIQSNN